jgi:hypothetical protein
MQAPGIHKFLGRYGVADEGHVLPVNTRVMQKSSDSTSLNPQVTVTFVFVVGNRIGLPLRQKALGATPWTNALG